MNSCDTCRFRNYPPDTDPCCECRQELGDEDNWTPIFGNEKAKAMTCEVCGTELIATYDERVPKWARNWPGMTWCLGCSRLVLITQALRGEEDMEP